jgi:hypothetical protein
VLGGRQAVQRHLRERPPPDVRASSFDSPVTLQSERAASTFHLARPRVELREHIHFDWKIYTMDIFCARASGT